MAELNKQFQHFKVDANERAQEGEKQLYELRTIADALENENTMVIFYKSVLGLRH